LSRAPELRLTCPAQSRYVALIRHALEAFLHALQFERDCIEDVTTAAGEALANVVEHAYADHGKQTARHFELRARILPSGKLAVDVSDDGSFIERKPLPGRGFGLRIIRAVAGKLTIDTAEGTCVRMTFDGLSSQQLQKAER
jgi:anti-sigma regulatory factor (Ser/Thr protein kinase)